MEVKPKTDQSISKIWVENCSMRGCGCRVLAAGNGRGWTDFTDINVEAVRLGEESQWKCHHFWEFQICSRLRNICRLPSEMSSSATLLRANCLKGFFPLKNHFQRWISFGSETLRCQLCSVCSISWLLELRGTNRFLSAVRLQSYSSWCQIFWGKRDQNYQSMLGSLT